MRLVKLKDVIRRANTKVDKDNTDLLYYVGGEHFDSGSVRVKRYGEIAGSTIGPMFYYGFKAGQFLLVSRNPHLKKAGIVSIDGICSEKTFVLETQDETVLLQEFLPFILQNELFWKYAITHGHGSTNRFINWSDLAEYEFCLPDIGQQRSLSNLLWSIERTRDAYLNLIEASDALIQSQFVEMFGELRTASRYDLVPLASILTVERGGSPRPIEDYITESADGVNWIKIGDAEEGSIYISRTKERIRPEGTRKSRHVEPGDFLLSNSMSFGRPYILQIDGYIHDGWLVLHDNNGVFNKLFLHSLLSSAYAAEMFASMAAGSVVKNLNKELVGRLPIPVPPAGEQERFASFVEEADKSKLAIRQALESLEKSRTAIMNRVFD